MLFWLLRGLESAPEDFAAGEEIEPARDGVGHGLALEVVEGPTIGVKGVITGIGAGEDVIDALPALGLEGKEVAGIDIEGVLADFFAAGVPLH